MEISKIANTNFKSNSQVSIVKKEKNNSSSETIGLDELNSNPIAYLNKANISFCGMKKSQFSGIDLIMVNKLTKEKDFNIQSKNINSNDDFQKYCQNKLDSEYYGEDNIAKFSKSIDPQAKMQKEAILNEWINYISKENDAYNSAIQLMIMSSITKNLEEKTNHLPPVLDKRKVADTISEITENSKTIKNYEPNFDKMYRNNIQKTFLNAESQLDSSLNGWIVIPSKINDPDNFEENVKKLQTLSHDSWCTKTYNAQPYLSKGDFHIYMEEGKPKLGVRFDKDEIQEIQGELNNTKIPQQYLDIAKAHVEENNYEQSIQTKDEFENAEEVKEEIKKIKSEIGENVFKNKEYDKILTHFGFKVEKDENGLLILDNYCQPNSNLTFNDLGIDENDLFKQVKEIKGNTSFRYSKITSLDNLLTIKGDADFSKSTIHSLGSLQSIEGDVNFNDSKVTSLGNLRSIKGSINLNKEVINELKNKLEIISNKEKYSIDDIKTIFDTTFINYKYNKEDNSFEIDKYYPLWKFGINEDELFNYIKHIKGDADFRGSFASSLNKIHAIDGNADFSASDIPSLGELQTIGGDAIIVYSNLIKGDFKNVKVEGDIKVW